MSICVGLKLAWGVVGASLDGSLIYPNAHYGRGLLPSLLWYALVSADGRAEPAAAIVRLAGRVSTGLLRVATDARSSLQTTAPLVRQAKYLTNYGRFV